MIEAPRPELYDLRADPGELENRYLPSDLAVQKFRGMLDEIKAKAPVPLSGAEARNYQERAMPSKPWAIRASPARPFPGSAAEASRLPDPKDKIEEQNLCILQ